nr:hypothetical protein [uncultured Pseudomonas sp.]
MKPWSLHRGRWKFSCVVLGLPLLLAGCDGAFSQERTVCVSGYNEFDLPIYEFWLDGENKSGCFGNPPAKRVEQIFGGGGKFSCGCKASPGKAVQLYWRFERTPSEVEAGIPPKEFKRLVTVPQPESHDSRYLRVYFMKDGSTPLQWVDDMGAPTLPSSIGKGKK